MRFLFAFGVIEINDFHTGRANTQISEQCRVSFNKISIPTDNMEYLLRKGELLWALTKSW